MARGSRERYAIRYFLRSVLRASARMTIFPGTGDPGPRSDRAHTDQPVTRFKSSNKKRIRKQAARFHLSSRATGELGAGQPACRCDGRVVGEAGEQEIRDQASAVPASGSAAARFSTLRAPRCTSWLPEGTISGANAAGPLLQGTFATTGTGGDPFSATVVLGQLRTDAQGRLLVLGGNGASQAPAWNADRGQLLHKSQVARRRGGWSGQSQDTVDTGLEPD